LGEKKYFSILLVPHDHKKIFNLKISTSTARIIVYILVGLGAGAWLFVRTHIQLKNEVLDLRARQQIYNEQVQRTLEFAREIENLKKQIIELKNLDMKVTGLSKELKRSRLPSPPLPYASGSVAERLGIGGVDHRLDANNPELVKKIEVDINKLKREIHTGKNLLTDLTKFLNAQLSVIRVTPNRWPLRGWITSRFGWRKVRGTKDFHTGIDIATFYGAPIKAAADGTVDFVGWKPGYGKLVIINHGRGIQTYYGHNSENLVHTGQFVKKGEVIARVGSTGHATGPHLHYEIRVNGNPVNPFKYLY